MRTVAVAVACALLGGAAGAVVVLAIDDDETSSGPVRQQPLASATDGAVPRGGLTPAEIYRRDAPGVVFIRAEVVRESASPFDLFPQQERGESTGTGFAVDDEGSILTNAHVVQDATRVRVRSQSGRVALARVRGIDPSTDLALLRVDPEGLGLRALRLGASRDVQVGDPTVAIGNPFGLDLTLTTGVISAKARRIEAPNGFQIADVLQTDAAINPGNSGGPLIDAAGRVIGINSAIRTGGDGGGSVGIGFAVPVDTARRILPQLRDRGRVERPFLGVTTATTEAGALVQAVLPEGPADRAGLRPGDVITRIGDTPVRRSEDVGIAVEQVEPGDEVRLEGRRGEERIQLDVELGRRG